MKRETLPKSYDPQSTEARWRDFWQQHKLSQANRQSSKPPFSIVIPPPNVTGRLHMGHALVQTIQDILARYKRMSGYEVMWVPGTDHAGISTQTVVERHLMRQQGLRRTDMTREQFLEYCWKWKQEYEESILEQIRLLGCSCDWSMLAFTMDESRSRAVRTAFARLFHQGLIYRGDYLVNWDPVTQTALADDEVEYEERQGHLWRIRYQLLNSGSIEVATTRPETLLGDTAIAVHPNDERYRHLIGQQALVPLLGRTIPIIADGFVDPNFGTGAVKVTPAHDPNDYQMGLRHALPMINLLNSDGTLNEAAGVYAGLTMAQAREKIVQDLKEQLVSTTAHPHRVGISYRSKAVIEPMLSKQWFFRLSAFKQTLRDAVEKGRVELIPAVWNPTYYHWIDNLRDWCISRQLWWGHRIPVWYHLEDPERVICHDGIDLPEEVAANPEQWRQEQDVLDTWFSSALWPLSTMGWPEQTPELERFYPTSVLVTGHDILFFWVARMMLMGELMTQQMPFSKVYLHGLIFAKSYWKESAGSISYITGQERKEYDSGRALEAGVYSRWEKMSKTRGNVIDPIEMITTYGTDAMRMALASSVGDARQIDLDLRRLEEYKNFSNKLFNSARFVLMNLDQEPALDPQQFVQGLNESLLLTEDRWIIDSYQKTIEQLQNALERFEFAEAAKLAYSFFWDELCAYYLEISKPVLWGKAATAAHRINKQKLLAILLCGCLRMLHPFTPYITEELLSHLRDRLHDSSCPVAVVDPLTADAMEALAATSCMVSSFPKTSSWSFPQACATMHLLREAIYRIRQLRSEMKVPTGQPTDLLIQGSGSELELMREHEDLLRALLPLKEVRFNTPAPEGQLAAQASLSTLALLVPLPVEMAQAEAQRLRKVRATLERNIDHLRSRLSSDEFIKKAPPQLVEKQTLQLATFEGELQLLNQQLLQLES